MAKTIEAEAPEDQNDSGDAPLIDLNDADIKKMVARAKKRGYITVDDLNAVVGEMSTDQIEDVMSALNEMGVNVVENDEASDDGDDPKDDEEEIAAVDATDDGTGHVA